MTKTENQPKAKPDRNKHGRFAKGNKISVKGNEKRTLAVKRRKKFLMSALDGLEKIHVKDLAQALEISKSTAHRLVQNINGDWERFLAKKKQALDAESLKIMKKLLKVAGEGRFAPAQALIGYGILADKVAMGTEKPLMSVEIGSKKLTVVYPSFNKNAEKPQAQVTPTLPLPIEEKPARTSLKDNKPIARQTGPHEVETPSSNWSKAKTKPKRL